jgi:hypothetical protein
VGRWNPWTALDARPDVVLRHAPLAGTLIGLCDVGADGRGPATITLACDLTRRERTAVLAHELVHLERGGGIDYEGAPAAWNSVVAREERIVDREVACRLVPEAELRRFARARAGVDEPITIDDVMEEWDVPEWVARDACVNQPRAGPPRA